MFVHYGIIQSGRSQLAKIGLDWLNELYSQHL